MKRASIRKRTVVVGIAVAILVPVVLWAQWTTSGNDIYNTNSGNVGIGMTSTGGKLEVTGAIRAFGTAGGFTAFDRTTTGRSVFYRMGGVARLWDDSAGDVIAFDSAANVGIGTTNPAEKLDVNGSVRVRGWDAVFHSYDGAGRYQDLIGTYQGWEPEAVYIAGYNAANYPGARATTKVSIGGDGSERLWVNLVTGNVGIGTTSPSAKLDVAGDVNVSGNISAKYQDIAEWVPSSQSLSSGSVVVLTPGQENSVVRSISAYDTRVAGVVSANPGIILGEAGEGKVRVATTGRVIVRVDANAAPIEVGDLLVTSSKEGMAMKSQPVSFGGVEMHRPGTLIGKALESLSEGEGEILVLLSLQ